MYRVLAVAVLAVHLAWILWVIFGYAIARRSAGLRWFHVGSLLYGVFIEIAPWPCPLTVAEQWLESRAGIDPYRQPFLVHYLEAFVYPDIPETALVGGAIVVCAANLLLYALLLRRRGDGSSAVQQQAPSSRQHVGPPGL